VRFAVDDDSSMDRGQKVLIVMIIIIAVIGGIYALLHFGTAITPAESHIEESYKTAEIKTPEYQATLLGRDIHDQVKVTSDVQSGTVGRYYIRYQFSLLNIPIREKEVPVDITDTEAPTIYLRNGDVSFSRIDEEVALPEYAVTDDYDQNPAVTFDGVVREDKEGIYPARVRACDQSANCTSIDISVVVGEISNDDLKPGKFNLRNYFGDNVILNTAAEPISEDDFRKIYFVGDSNLLNMGMYESDISESRVMAQYTLSPGTFDSPVWYNGNQVNANTLTLIQQTQPEILVLDIGKSELDLGGKFYGMITQYQKVIEDIQAASPSTRILICSLLPTPADVDGKASQTELNEANYCLAKMCSDMNLEMLYTAEAFYNDKGYGTAEYYNEDGYNLSGSYFNLYTQYIMDHVSVN